MAKPTLSIFTGSKTLGTVFSEDHQLNVKFTEFNIPFTSETGNTAINWKGKTRVILVQGAHDGVGFDGVSSESKLADFIYEIEQWITGASDFEGIANIQGAITYTDSFGNTYSVKCFDWSWRRSFADPNRIVYSLLLKRV